MIPEPGAAGHMQLFQAIHQALEKGLHYPFHQVINRISVEMP